MPNQQCESTEGNWRQKDIKTNITYALPFRDYQGEPVPER